MFNREARVYVAGHQGLVGSSIVRRLRQEGFERLLLPTRAQLDLRNQAHVDAWFEESKPDYVFLAAGTVGGIWANATRPAEFIYDNLMIHATVVHAAYRHDATKLLYLGSSCSYPREAAQPMPEEALLTGPLEPTNEPYAVAKIAGIKLCKAYRQQYGCDFISVMPTNVYSSRLCSRISSSIPAIFNSVSSALKSFRFTSLTLLALYLLEQLQGFTACHQLCGACGSGLQGSRNPGEV